MGKHLEQYGPAPVPTELVNVDGIKRTSNRTKNKKGGA